MEKFIFDIDGTLLKANWEYEKIYFNSVLSQSDAEVFIPNISRLLADYENKYQRYDIDLLSQHLTSSTGVNITPDIISGWFEAGKNYYDVIDGAYETLEYLKSKGKKIIALSNWFTEVNRTRLEKSGLLGYFDSVYCGDMIDMKPNRSSYLTACGDTSLSEVVMVGDSIPFDIAVPLELGIETIHYCPKGTKQIDNPKVKVIRRLNEIKEMY